MPDANLVQPLDPSQSPAAPQAQATPQEVQPAQGAAAPAGPALPHDLLKQPAMQALMAGAPPAASIPIKEFGKRDEGKLLAKNKDLLQQAGFMFYRSMHGNTGVIFNALHIHPEDIQAADKAGKLQAIAPPWDVIDHAVAKSGHNNPVLTRTHAPAGFATPTPKAPPQMNLPPGASPAPAAPIGPSQPAGAQRALATARARAMQPGAPTSGPEPGAGRLLNQILKPVV